jgi:hypothetical protein
MRTHLVSKRTARVQGVARTSMVDGRAVIVVVVEGMMVVQG